MNIIQATDKICKSFCIKLKIDDELKSVCKTTAWDIPKEYEGGYVIAKPDKYMESLSGFAYTEIDYSPIIEETT